MKLKLRPATPADLPFRVSLHNTLFPWEPTTLGELQRQDDTRRPDLVFRRFIAELGGQPIGQGLYAQQEWMYHPQKFYVTVQLGRGWQGQGIGKQIWAALEADLRAMGAVKLFASVREDEARALRFLVERGFAEEQREREASLLLAQAQLDGLDAALERVRLPGYALMTFAEWPDPGKELKLYKFDEAASHDVPRPNEEQFNFPTFERYWETIHANPKHDPSLWFVAVKGGELVGLSQLNLDAAQPAVLNTGFTATARPHRRQGLAQALKLLALSEARKRGYSLVKTANDSTNLPMIAINTALGFVEQPAWLWMTRRSKGRSS